MRFVSAIVISTLLTSFSAPAAAAEPTRSEVVAEMRPYGSSTAGGHDASTLTGKVTAGYQG